MDKDLDVVNFVRLVQGFRSLLVVLFSQEQRFFLKFQRGDVLHTDTTESEEGFGGIDSEEILKPIYYEQSRNNEAQLQHAKKVIKRHLKDIISNERDELVDGLIN